MIGALHLGKVDGRDLVLLGELEGLDGPWGPEGADISDSPCRRGGRTGGLPGRCGWEARWPGPERCPGCTTEVSIIPDRENPSTIRANPPSEVVTMGRTPAYEAPKAMLIGGDLVLLPHDPVLDGFPGAGAW